MDDTINVLITCASSQIMPNVIKLIREYKKHKLRVIGIDSKPLELSIGAYYCDLFYQSPMGKEKGYSNFIRNLVKKEKINIIFPGSDEEVLKLSKIKQELKEEKCHVTCSSKEITHIAADKYKMLCKLKENNIPIGKFYNPTSLEELKKFSKYLGYPKKKFIIKPKKGRGSRGLRIINSEKIDKFQNFFLNNNFSMTLEELFLFFKDNPNKISDFILMEYLPGDKYSADILTSNGEVKSMVIRNNWKKLKTNPPTQLADIVFDKDVREYSTKICNLMKFDYFIQIESGRGDDKKLYFIETNPRLDATLPITTGLGINFYHEMIDYSIQGYFNEGIDILSGKKKRFFRFWDHKFVEA